MLNMVYGRDDLDVLVCDEDGCTGGHEGIYFHSKCHKNAGTWVKYTHGTASIECAECGNNVISLVIADKGCEIIDEGLTFSPY